MKQPVEEPGGCTDAPSTPHTRVAFRIQLTEGREMNEDLLLDIRRLILAHTKKIFDRCSLTIDTTSPSFAISIFPGSKISKRYVIDRLEILDPGKIEITRLGEVVSIVREHRSK